MKYLLYRYGLYWAWITSIFSTLGSLYLSEVMGFEPCKLCWYQRIFMYPQTILLGIAAYRDDRGLIRYIIPLNLIGSGIALFHYLEQKVPGFAKISPCTVGVPCNYDYLDWFGIITIPLLALLAFVIIIICLLVGRSEAEERV